MQQDEIKAYEQFFGHALNGLLASGELGSALLPGSEIRAGESALIDQAHRLAVLAIERRGEFIAASKTNALPPHERQTLQQMADEANRSSR
jgi:hypothetical protein